MFVRENVPYTLYRHCIVDRIELSRQEPVSRTNGISTRACNYSARHRHFISYVSVEGLPDGHVLPTAMRNTRSRPASAPKRSVARYAHACFRPTLSGRASKNRSARRRFRERSRAPAQTAREVVAAFGGACFFFSTGLADRRIQRPRRGRIGPSTDDTLGTSAGRWRIVQNRRGRSSASVHVGPRECRARNTSRFERRRRRVRAGHARNVVAGAARPSFPRGRTAWAGVGPLRKRPTDAVHAQRPCRSDAAHTAANANDRRAGFRLDGVHGAGDFTTTVRRCCSSRTRARVVFYFHHARRYHNPDAAGAYVFATMTTTEIIIRLSAGTRSARSRRIRRLVYNYVVTSLHNDENGARVTCQLRVVTVTPRPFDVPHDEGLRSRGT